MAERAETQDDDDLGGALAHWRRFAKSLWWSVRLAWRRFRRHPVPLKRTVESVVGSWRRTSAAGIRRHRRLFTPDPERDRVAQEHADKLARRRAEKLSAGATTYVGRIEARVAMRGVLLPDDGDRDIDDWLVGALALDDYYGSTVYARLTAELLPAPAAEPTDDAAQAPGAQAPEQPAGDSPAGLASGSDVPAA